MTETKLFSVEGKKSAGFELDLSTKGHCFLCLIVSNNESNLIENSQQKLIKQEAPNCNAAADENVITSFKNLCRHLHINLEKLVSENIKIPEILEKVKNAFGEKTKLKVFLCGECSRTTKRFSDLFQELERITLEMDHCLETISHGISNGDGDPELQQSYQELMSEDMYSLFMLGFIDKLKKEISLKCVISCLSQQTPRVTLFSRTVIASAKFIGPESATQDSAMPIAIPPSAATSAAADVKIKDGIQLQHHSGKATSLKFTCKICNERFQSPIDVRYHKRRAHTHTGLLQPSAFVGTGTKMLLRRRNEVRMTTTKSLTDTHQHQRKKKRTSRLKQFVRDNTTGKFQCCHPFCSLQFSTRSTAQIHYESVHLKIRRKCLECLKDFSSYSSLFTHKRLHCVGIISATEKLLVSSGDNKEEKAPSGKVLTERLSQNNHCDDNVPSTSEDDDDMFIPIRIKPLKKKSKFLKKRIKSDSPNGKPNALETIRKYLGVCSSSSSFINMIPTNSNCNLPKREFSSSKKGGPPPSFQGRKKKSWLKIILEDEATRKFKCPEPKCTKLFSTRFSANAHHQALHLKRTLQCFKCERHDFKYLAAMCTHRKTCDGTKAGKQTQETPHFSMRRMLKPNHHLSRFSDTVENNRKSRNQIIHDRLKIKRKIEINSLGEEVKTVKKAVEDFNCIKCNKDCISESDREDHFKAVHLNNPYKCDSCKPCYFTYRKAFYNHKMVCPGRLTTTTPPTTMTIPIHQIKLSPPREGFSALKVEDEIRDKFFKELGLQN